MYTIEDTGTASVSAGGSTVTGVGTIWVGKVFKGDLFTDPAQGIFARVTADATSNTSLSIKPWPGADMSGDAYEILLWPDSVRSSERARRYLEIASQIENTGIEIRAFGDFVDRDAFDAQSEGFTFLSWDGDGDTITEPVLFVRDGATAGVWQVLEYKVSIADILTELGVTKITVSTENPSGGSDGDLWFKVSA